MKTKTMLTAMAIVIAMTLFSCEGKQGATGPAGVANVYSNEITVQQSQWTNVSNTDDYYVEITDANITNGDADLVEVYFLSSDLENSSDNGWSPLPSGGYYYNVYNGGIELQYYSSGSSTPITLTLNIVVIPQPALAKMKQQDVNLNDFNQVNAYMKLNTK
jgi:hypothetical protein